MAAIDMFNPNAGFMNGLPQSPQQVFYQYLAAGYSPQFAASMSGYAPPPAVNPGGQGARGGNRPDAPAPAQPAAPTTSPITTPASLTAPSATNNPNLTMAQAQQTTQQNNPLSAAGMNPNPTAVQQFQWAPGGGPNPGQLNAAAPDGPLAPEYQNMQAAVQAGIARNSGRPQNYSLATNDPNVWIDPSTGGTWSTPGYSFGAGGYNPAQVFGTNPANNRSPYSLPSGNYEANPKTGAVTPMVQATAPPASYPVLGPPPMTTQTPGPDPFAQPAQQPAQQPQVEAMGSQSPWTAAGNRVYGGQQFQPQFQPFNPMQMMQSPFMQMLMGGMQQNPFGGGMGGTADTDMGMRAGQRRASMLAQFMGGFMPQQGQQNPFGGQQQNLFAMFSQPQNPYGGMMGGMSGGNPFASMFGMGQQQNPFASMFGGNRFGSMPEMTPYGSTFGMGQQHTL